ncbi:MAG: DUF2065 domain-containing protein [Gammaproteobacteria bacterium]|nr:DUF2065 domain-containing protein [Gammaproteobacteria bacterium]
MWIEILIGLSLMFVIEGLILAVGPDMCKKAMHEIQKMPASALRIAGLGSMLFGLIMLLVVT